MTAVRMLQERQCVGCKRQTEWGCHAEKVPSDDKTLGAFKEEDGRWWLWLNPARLPMTVDGEESYACPRQPLHEEPFVWNRILLFYSFYKKGHLPQVGAVQDQSAKAMEVFRVLDDINFEVDEALAAEARRKAADAIPANRQPLGRRGM